MRLLTFFAALAFTFALQAQEVCESYISKSAQLGCDSRNYLTAYGYRYCRSFEVEQREFSSQGQRILTKLRTCLINALNEPSLTCESVGDFALQSHVTCYVESGFCEMNALDQMHVMWMIREEVMTPEFASVGSMVAAECALGGF